MATGMALCPFCASKGILTPYSGEIATPTGTFTVNFKDPKTFAKAEAQIQFHRSVDGRPVIEHKCPSVGHQVWLYTDTDGTAKPA